MDVLFSHLDAQRRRVLARWLLGFTGLWIVALAATAVRTFLRDGDTGDYQHYYHAARAVMDGGNIYQQFERQYGYLPMWAIVQTTLAPLGPGGAGAVWTVCNVGLIFAALWMGSGEILRRLGVEAEVLLRACVIATAALVLSDKIRAELRLGQTDAVILVSFILALKWLDRRPRVSGVFLGFIANFKLQSMVMVPYFVVRGRWAALASTMVCGTALALCGVLIWGWQRNCEYLGIAFGSILQMMGVAKDIADGPGLFPLAWGRSVSLPSTLARIGESAGMPRLALLGTGVLALGAVGVAWGMYARRGKSLFMGRMADGESATGRRLALLEWCGLIMGALAFSPQTTVRHLYLMLFVAMTAAGLAFTLPSRRGRAVLFATLGACWLGMSLPGGDALALEAKWKWIGGPVLVSLVLFYVTLWFGLGADRESDERPAASRV